MRGNNMETKVLVDSVEMARILGLNPRTIGNWAKEEIIPCIRMGYKTIRFNPEKVIAALEKAGKKK